MDTEEVTKLLSTERERVEEALAALDDGARDSLQDREGDQGEPGEGLVSADHDAGRRERLEDELHAIERAEQRLADGRYGLSVESGDPIPDDRLRAQPTAERTVSEQQRFAR